MLPAIGINKRERLVAQFLLIWKVLFNLLVSSLHISTAGAQNPDQIKVQVFPLCEQVIHCRYDGWRITERGDQNIAGTGEIGDISWKLRRLRRFDARALHTRQ